MSNAIVVKSLQDGLAIERIEKERILFSCFGCGGKLYRDLRTLRYLMHRHFHLPVQSTVAH